jgi:glycosyltransferase involved in cell wall biosynthesis/SAM-dependent methyltransferase
LSFDQADEDLFRAYHGVVDPGARAYLEVHYRRYQTTLAFLAAHRPKRILELGAIGPYLFTLMLARRFPHAELVLAHWEVPTHKIGFSAATESRLKLPAKAPGYPDHSFALHSFNAERDVWPFDAGAFDLVISMEMLEHLLLDPCFLYREAHRVLARDGRLVVTTPNVASREGVNLLLANNAPYRYGPYSAYGEYGRHNREYVPRELARIGEACGLGVGQLATHDVYPIYGDMEGVERLLANYEPALRGQNIFYDGVKDGRPYTAYPDGLFDYAPPERTAILRVRRSKRAAGELRLTVEATNTGRQDWLPDSTCLGIQWLERRSTEPQPPAQPDRRVPLAGVVRPGDTAVLECALRDPGQSLKLDMFHEGTGWFYTGKIDDLSRQSPSRMDRSVVLELPPVLDPAPRLDSAARLPGPRPPQRVLIATTQVPFVRGGAELHAEGLLAALRGAGCEAEIAAIPFKWYPPERILDAMLCTRLCDWTEYSGASIDLLIGLKFPAYLVPHPRKVLWILHQHRAAYDLWGHPVLGDLHRFPDGAQVREAILQADRKLIPEARAVYANSRNVERRLRRYCGVESRTLYHPPPNAGRFHCADAEDFLFCPSRLNLSKRQDLVLEALARTRQPVVVNFAGAADEASFAEQLRAMANRLGLEKRVHWLGNITEEEKIEQYAKSLGVIFPPVDEDYGYISLEAMLSSKPVITCTDAGGPLEFIEQGATGLVAEPTAASLAEAMDRLWEDRAAARRMGQAARARYGELRISWDTVIETLLGG